MRDRRPQKGHLSRSPGGRLCIKCLFIIGLNGTPDDDALGKLAAVRAKLALLEDVGKRIQAATVTTLD